MSGAIRCPECGAAEVEAHSGSFRCRSCGAALAYRMPWGSFLLIAAAVGALVGVGSHFVIQAVAPGLDALRPFLAGGLAGLGAVLVSRRMRRLTRA